MATDDLSEPRMAQPGDPDLAAAWLSVLAAQAASKGDPQAMQAAYDAHCRTAGREDLLGCVRFSESHDLEEEVREIEERCEAARLALPLKARAAVDAGRATLAVDPENSEVTLIYRGEQRIAHMTLNPRRFRRELKSIRSGKRTASAPSSPRARGRESHRGRPGHRRATGTPRAGPEDGDSDAEPPSHAAGHRAALPTRKRAKR